MKSISLILLSLLFVAFCEAKRTCVYKLESNPSDAHVVCVDVEGYSLPFYVGKTPVEQRLEYKKGLIGKRKTKVQFVYFKDGYIAQVETVEWRDNGTIEKSVELSLDEVGIYPRKLISTCMRGLTLEELMEILGRPDSTTPVSYGHLLHYKNLTFDELSLKPDSVTQFILEGGKVSRVNYL